jgi:hypothetical protein
LTRARDVASVTDLANAKGDIYTATADNTPAVLTVGANNALLVANSGATAGVNWSSTLSGLTLTSPTIGSITNTGTLTLPTSSDTLVGRATTDTLTNKSLQGPYEIGQQLSAAGGALNLDVLSGTFVWYTSTTTANFTVNIRGNGSTTLASLIAVGQPVTISLIVNNTTAYYMTALTIDGSAPTLIKWSGGSAPSAGNASSYDAYSFTIWKYAATPTYIVFASGPVKYA